MCNRYGYLAPISRLADEFSQTRIPLRFKDGAIPNIEPREHIRPTNTAPILRPLDRDNSSGSVELVDARWWLVPYFHKGTAKEWKPMCTNARSETVETTAAFREPYKRRRCLVPATHFYEWTGLKGDKTMWCLTKAGSELFYFAGLWGRADTADGPVESLTILTCAPGPDCEPYHTRQPVILEPDQWVPWLDLIAAAGPIMRAGAVNTISIERAAV